MRKKNEKKNPRQGLEPCVIGLTALDLNSYTNWSRTNAVVTDMPFMDAMCNERSFFFSVYLLLLSYVFQTEGNKIGLLEGWGQHSPHAVLTQQE